MEVLEPNQPTGIAQRFTGLRVQSESVITEYGPFWRARMLYGPGPGPWFYSRHTRQRAVSYALRNHVDVLAAYDATTVVD